MPVELCLVLFDMCKERKRNREWMAQYRCIKEGKYEIYFVFSIQPISEKTKYGSRNLSAGSEKNDTIA